MVNSKTDILDEVFAALADPTRRAILARLAGGADLVGSLAEPHDMSMPAVSKHLRVLESAGLIRREKSGRTVICHLQAQPMRQANQWLVRYQRFWRGRLDALAQYLDQPASAEGEKSPWPPSSNPRKSRSGSRASIRTRARKSSAPGPTRRR